MSSYCKTVCIEKDCVTEDVLRGMEDEVRKAGAEVIALKGATYYAIAMSVRRICECIIRDTDSVMTVCMPVCTRSATRGHGSSCSCSFSAFSHRL